jgi:hypothetical protein
MLDAVESSTMLNSSTSHDDRKGVWELMHMDMFFRLLFSKPPTITSSLEKWRVNLPQLSVDADDQAVPAMVFLFNSRITFIIVSFFRIVEEECSDAARRLASIETLCREIEDLFAEWQLVSTKESKNRSTPAMLTLG